MSNKSYSDEEIETFITTASDVGIARAQRELGYPNSWATANRWIKSRGIEITVDSLKSKSAEFNQWYDTEETLIIAQAGMDRVYETLMEQNLLPDDQKKMAEAFQKYANTWMLLKGRSTNITETRSVGELNLEVQQIIEEEEAKKRANKIVAENN